MDRSKWVSAVLVAVVALGSPLAALAQAPPGPQYPDALKAPYPYPGSAMSEQPPPAPDPRLEPTEGDKTGAFFLNLAYVPGKAIICGVGTLTSALVMGLTLGSGYRQAVGVFNEGCHGTWVLTPEHVSGKIPAREDVD
ncbi:MAG TPA: hypothetical protein VJA45_03230 [Methylomirabilota bacterium]|jgi:hypothetical protein|nr:hypothetical protein [Methylomirabilota bacterium]